MKKHTLSALFAAVAIPAAAIAATSGGANAADPEVAAPAPAALPGKIQQALRSPQTVGEARAAKAFKLGDTARVVGKSATGATVLVSKPDAGVTCVSIATDWAVIGCAYDTDVARGKLAVVRGGESSGLGADTLEVVGIAPEGTSGATAAAAGKSAALTVDSSAAIYTGTFPASAPEISLSTAAGTTTVPLR